MKSILLVEDEFLLREGFQEVLEIQGYKVIGAGDGLEALEWIQKAHIDLVITDIVMPKMDGVDFVAKLRKSHPTLPVLVVTGSTGAVMSRFGLKSLVIPGANDCLVKPFLIVDLIDRVKALLV